MNQILLAQLCQASLDKAFIPETAVDWKLEMPPGALIVPESLVSLYGLDDYANLSEPERALLMRHEVASLLSFAIRLETVLIYRFALLIRRADPLAPWLPYVFHEIEEEARHSRMFVRTIGCLGTGGYCMDGALGYLESKLALLTRSTALFVLLTLAAEELPDALFKKVAADGGSHPILSQVSRIHRIEEARHIKFGRDYFVDLYALAGRSERWLIRQIAPVMVAAIFDALVRPSVYLRAGVVQGRVGAWGLWLRARACEQRRQLRIDCARRLVRFLEEHRIIDPQVRPRWVAYGLLQ